MKRRRNIVGHGAVVAVAVVEVLAATPITPADNARIKSVPVVACARGRRLVIDGGRAPIIAAEQIGGLHEHTRLLEGCAEEARRRAKTCVGGCELTVGCPEPPISRADTK